MASLVSLDIPANSRIATLALNRPEKRNALSRELIADLHSRITQLSSREDISVCILTGAGPTFCAGMDLKAALKEPGAPLQLLSAIAELTIALRNLPMTTLARVNGAAIGGGCGLVAVCDFAITHHDAKLGYPEVDLGVCPAVVAPWLVQAIGAGRARRVLLEGGTMTGTRAFEIGLVSEVVAADQLDAAVAARAQRLAQAGPHAMRATRRLLNSMGQAELEALVRKGAHISAEVIAGEEAQRCLAKIYGS